MNVRLLPRMVWLSLVGLVLVGVTGVGSTSAVGQQLAWKLVAGEQFSVSFDQKSTTKTDVDGRRTTINSSTIMSMDWDVIGVDAKGIATIQQTITSLLVAVGDPAVPAKAISFDTGSTAKPSKESAKILAQIKPLIGLKFDVSMNPQGEILNVKPQPAALEILQTLGGSLELQALFSEQGVQDIWGAAAIVLPTTELTPGASWTKSDNVENALGTFARERTYTFSGNGTGDEQALALFEIVATLEPVSTPAEDAGSLLAFNESGSLKFNTAGYFVSSQSKSSTHTTLPYREKTIDTVVENSIEMTIEKR